MINTIRRLPLIGFSILLTRRHRRHKIRPSVPSRPSRHRVTFVLNTLRKCQVRRRQRNAIIPYNSSRNRERFHSTTSTRFHNLLIGRPLRSTIHHARRTIITGRRVRQHTTSHRRLNSTKKVHVNRVRLHPGLISILRQKQRRSNTMLLVPLARTFRQLKHLLRTFTRSPARFPATLQWLL